LEIFTNSRIFVPRAIEQQYKFSAWHESCLRHGKATEILWPRF